MNNGFLSGRGRYLYDTKEKDFFFSSERSRSTEHPSEERSENSLSVESEKAYKSKKNEENES